MVIAGFFEYFQICSMLWNLGPGWKDRIVLVGGCNSSTFEYVMDVG